jgi:hypothetical protein
MPFGIGRCSARPARFSSWRTDAGTADIAAELGVRYVPEVTRNTFGKLLVSDLFKQAQQLSVNHFFCYVNSDILLMSDFMQVL